MPTTASTPGQALTASDQSTIPDPTPEPPAVHPPAAPVGCDACDASAPPDQIVITIAGIHVCPACQQADYWRCPDCDGWNRDGYPCGNYCNDEDDPDDDDDVEEPDGDLIQTYSYKPYPEFHGTGPLFLGLELEIATPYDRWGAARLAGSRLGQLGYLKADESIGGGFELVTHPMTYPWALAHFPWRLLTDLADAGCRATDRCGLHVHLSRDGFASPAHVYRWMTFVYRNQAPVTALARRESEEWARFDDDDRHRVKDYAKGALGYYRYRAINTQNPDTFELRMFASSLQPVQVQAALAFAAATVEYTRTLTVATITRRDGWAWPAFTGWLTDRPLYAPLLDQVQTLTVAGRSCVIHGGL